MWGNQGIVEHWHHLRRRPGDNVGGRFRIVRVTCIRPAVPESPGWESMPDHDSGAWVRGLDAHGADYDETVARLHDLLLRVARAEVYRRRAQLPMAGPELDDLAHQAAADAVMGVVRRVGEFRGESRFTTWACKFAIFEVSTKVGRHFWRRPTVAMDGEDWDRLPDRFGLGPAGAAEWRDVVAALHRAVDEELTDHQRRIFVAIVLNGVPLDALVAQLGSNRNAIYKTLFDARRKLRAALVTHGYLDDEVSRQP